MAISHALLILEILIRKDFPVTLDANLAVIGKLCYYKRIGGDAIPEEIKLKFDLWAYPEAFLHEVAHLCQCLQNGEMEPIGIEVAEHELEFWTQRMGPRYDKSLWGIEIEAEVMGNYRIAEFVPLMIDILEEELPDRPPDKRVFLAELTALRKPFCSQ